MQTKEWAAIHRKHHAKVETADDPHSPQIKGIKRVLLEGAELYIEEAKNQETLDHYGEGTPNDWLEKNFYTRFSYFGVTLLFMIDVLLFGLIGVTIWAIQMAWIPFFAAGVINGIGHYWGYRNYECKDASRNIIPFGIFMCGEELHNNHHAFATSAKFSAKWWEIDFGWVVIKFLQLFGLAKPKRVLSHLKVLPTKTAVDDETLKAIISHRLQVMARYTGEVILPALKEEKKRASKKGRSLLHRARSILIRDLSILKSTQRQRLATILHTFQSLKTVYHFRLKLQAIWNRRMASQNELLDAIQEWCHQAEATGIEALRKFSRQLKTYVPSSS